MIGTRELTAVALLPLLIAGIALLPPWVYLAVVWIVALLAAWELTAILSRIGHPVLRAGSLAAIAVGLPAAWLLGLPWALAAPGAVVLLLPVAYLLSGKPVTGAAAGIAVSVFTAGYFIVTAGAMGLLRTEFPGPTGWKLVLLCCLSIWSGDSGAYYLGSWLGRHRLAPRVSPKKSWEGVLGGTLATFFGVWVCRTVFFPELDLATGLAMAAALSVLAPLGDLAESLFKRDAGIKDSSDLIPGHGGFLDRTDSLFFVAPFVVALALLAGLGR